MSDVAISDEDVCRYPVFLEEAGLVFGADVEILSLLLVSVALDSGMIVFMISIRELVASLMLAPSGAETVATNQFYQGAVNVGMAMSLLSIVISGTFISIGQWLQKSIGGMTFIQVSQIAKQYAKRDVLNQLNLNWIVAVF
ncbi:MAG: hypothetical protein CENE_02000 [Candidatus Celerinatantimonas neptuna]|nr:MAG: hypothetical protein CENE_02000 [Candidatus Celerinatantimonas neptuna]